jgi:tetratricopeptide (TPR) repeat protein
MNYRVPFLSLLLCVGVVLAAAQDNRRFASPLRHGIGIYSANYSLSGSVSTFANHPVRDARVEIRVLNSGEPMASGYTLPNGSFELPNVPRGIYEVVATVGILEARERVDIDRPEISVHLRLPGEDAGQTSGRATVSVSQLKVPEKAKKFFAKAEEAFQKQKFDQSRQHLEKALQLFPAYAQALTLRGLLQLQDNNLDQALADLEQAVKIDYGYGLGYVVLGATYNLMKRYDDSVRVLERGIVLSPASWQAYTELSKALLGKGQFEPALRQVNKASALAPASYMPIHLIKAHALLGLKNYDLAVAELEQFLGNRPDGVDSAKARETLNQVRAFMAASGK